MRKATPKLKHGFLWMAFMVACMSLQAQSSVDFRSLFWKQMGGTCKPGLKWEKSVVEYAEDGSPNTETKVFEVDCFKGFATSGDVKIPLNPEEFGHMFEYTFDNPSYAGLLVVDRSGQSVHAVVTADAKDDCKLQKQGFEVDEATGVLRSAHTHIVKNSPLYDLEVTIEVKFDAQGQYTGHEIETETKVWLGGTLHSVIHARLL